MDVVDIEGMFFLDRLYVYACFHFFPQGDFQGLCLLCSMCG